MGKYLLAGGVLAVTNLVLTVPTTLAVAALPKPAVIPASIAMGVGVLALGLFVVKKAGLI